MKRMYRYTPLIEAGAQEHIQGGTARRKHVQSLRSITLKLIQGYIEEDGPDGPDRSKQCPIGLKFLAEMERAMSVDSLRKVWVSRLRKTEANCSSIHFYNFPGTEVALLV
jgi:hypothetical protein